MRPAHVFEPGYDTVDFRAPVKQVTISSYAKRSPEKK